MREQQALMQNSNYFIYLLSDPDDDRKYVGLTTNGIWRFTDGHMRGADSQLLQLWFHDMKCRGKVPNHVVLQRAPMLWQLQLLEIIFIRVLTVMGEHLLNQTAGGESGVHRRNRPEDPTDPRWDYDASNIISARKEIYELIHPPNDKVAKVYAHLVEVGKRYPGFSEEHERYKALFAKESLVPEPTVDLAEIPKSHVPTITIVKSVSKRLCSHEGCGKDHHANGLCRKHDDKRRTALKKAKRESLGTCDRSSSEPSVSEM